jgi:hypothetical protein
MKDKYDKRMKNMVEMAKAGSEFIIEDENGGESTRINFSRASMDDWERIKKLPNKELIEEYISISVMISISFSVNDLQIQGMLATEINKRNLNCDEIEKSITEGTEKLERALCGENEEDVK